MVEDRHQKTQLVATRDRSLSIKKKNQTPIGAATAFRWLVAVLALGIAMFGGIEFYNRQVMGGTLRQASIMIGSDEYRFRPLDIWSIKKYLYPTTSTLPGPAAGGWIVSIYSSGVDANTLFKCVASVDAAADLDAADEVTSRARLRLVSRHGPFASQIEAVIGLERAGWEKQNYFGFFTGYVARSGC